MWALAIGWLVDVYANSGKMNLDQLRIAVILSQSQDPFTA